MATNLDVFLKCQTNSSNIFEVVGNFLLSPVRYYWEGRTVKIGHLMAATAELENVLDNHVLAEPRMSYNEHPITELFRTASLILGIVPGVLSKSLAFLSPTVRARHFTLKETLSPPKNLPEGVSIKWGEIVYPNFTVTLDLAQFRQKEGADLETYVAKKLLQVKPNLFIGNVGKFDLVNPPTPNVKLDGMKRIKVSEDKEVTLSMLLYSRRLDDSDFGQPDGRNFGIQAPVNRTADPETRWGCCNIGHDWLLSD